MLYMRGHLCFFRAGSSTQAKLNKYPHVASLDKYIAHHRPHFAAGMCALGVTSFDGSALTIFPDTEEAEFSAFIFRDPTITFLILPHHLADVAAHLVTPNHAKLCTLHGVFVTAEETVKRSPASIQENLPILFMPSVKSTPSIPTFTSKGSVRPVELLRENIAKEVWFPMEFVTYYEIDFTLTKEGSGWRRFVGRGGRFAGGSEGVWERLEPPLKTVSAWVTDNPDIKVPLREGLYSHFFEEKRRTG